MKRWLLLAVAALAVSGALASSLTLAAPSLPVIAKFERCADATVAVEVTEETAEFELPEYCVGADLELFVTDGTTESTATTTAARNN